MDQPTAPWQTGWQPPLPTPPKAPKPPPAPQGNPAWKDANGKGVSGNPAGRPVGRPDRRLLATQAALDEMRSIMMMLVARALEGDTNAASIVLSKVLPSVKAQAEKVNFDLDTDAPISAQVSSVLDAVAGGILAPDVARLIIDSIKSLSDIRATEELSARIEALEEARDARR